MMLGAASRYEKPKATIPVLESELMASGATWLDAVSVIEKLHEAFGGFHADLGARHGLWHPKQEIFQALHYFYRHIGSMDRGIMPQWPQWNTTMGIVEVPIDYAVLHDDFPVVSLGLFGEDDEAKHDSAWVEKPIIQDVRRIGWAETFWRILKADLGIEGLTPEWFARTFRVSMDWYATTKNSPLSASHREAARRGMVG